MGTQVVVSGMTGAKTKHLNGLTGRSEGDARTGYFIPGCDGIVGWRSSENSSSVAVATPPRVEIFILHIGELELI